MLTNQRPVALFPQALASAGRQTVSRMGMVARLKSSCGTVRHAPRKLKSARAPFHAASDHLSRSGARCAMSFCPPQTARR